MLPSSMRTYSCKLYAGIEFACMRILQQDRAFKQEQTVSLMSVAH